MNQQEFIEMIANRDGISYSEAEEQFNITKEQVQSMILSPTALTDIENELKYGLGVEMDYLDLFLW